MFRNLFILLIFLIAGCKLKSTEPAPATAPAITIKQEEKKPNFFPVTSFIKGQIADLKNRGINPLVYNTKGNKTDSVWLKQEDYEKVFRPYLTPDIDTTNQTKAFEEKSFVDQTINAITFSYDPINTLPDSASLRRWDVYIDPETQKVRRIYIVKKLASGNLLQLTWQAGQWCKLIELDPNLDGNKAIIKQQEVKWNF